MDIFSRQRAVPDWNQVLIEQQRALVLGVGGIGCSVARNLCRLGVSEVVLVDYDTVSPSNINRQVLYCVADIGRKKAEAAMEGLARDLIRTKVTPIHTDAVKEWSVILEAARRSTVIFNCIDYGEYFDYAISSLCVSLSLCYVSASSYGHTAVAECYPAVGFPQGGPCWACNNAPTNTSVLQQITPNRITSHRSLEFLPKDSFMPTNTDVGSSILPCSLGAMLATSGWVNSLHGYSLPHWTTCDYATFQLYSYFVEANAHCLICRNAPRYSSQIVELYFGIDTGVKLSPVNGQVIPYLKGSITNPVNDSLLDVSKRRLEPWSGLGTTHPSCYLPAIPAADLLVNEIGSDGDVSQLPDKLKRPLLKTEDGAITAIRSGNRSAVLCTPQACYRLKGCGNFVDEEGMKFAHPGFPQQEMEMCEGVEVKGCCFKHTAVTEQFMCESVGSALGREGVKVGNSPLLLWAYDIPEDTTPKLQKYCGVFETLGEKRLSSHLLPGLESLLPLLLPTLSLEQVLSFFPKDRILTELNEKEVKPTWCVEDQTSLVNMCTTPLQESPPSQLCDKIPPRFLGDWCRATYCIREALPLSEEEALSCGSLMALLYWQLGWEVGVVKRLLQEAGINWGYFFDHNPCEPHCNSHPNNFIVLPPYEANFLAPVDFDLAFTRKGFFSPYSKEPDAELFDSWVSSEHSELMRALGGEMANSGVTMAQTCPLTPEHRALSCALRDTMVLGYQRAYAASNRPNPHPTPSRLSPAIRSLTKAALVMTSKATS